MGTSFKYRDSAYAWVAGLYEGEGTCYLGCNSASGKAHNVKTPYVAIQMTDSEPLIRASEITGIGKVRGPYPPKGAYSKSAYYLWRFTAQQDVVDFFALIWPWLSTRRRAQAQPLIDQCKTRLKARASGGRYAKPIGFNNIPK